LNVIGVVIVIVVVIVVARNNDIRTSTTPVTAAKAVLQWSRAKSHLHRWQARLLPTKPTRQALLPAHKADWRLRTDVLLRHTCKTAHLWNLNHLWCNNTTITATKQPVTQAGEDAWTTADSI
jgi:hypothetical protein